MCVRAVGGLKAFRHDKQFLVRVIHGPSPASPVGYDALQHDPALPDPVAGPAMSALPASSRAHLVPPLAIEETAAALARVLLEGFNRHYASEERRQERGVGREEGY